MNKIIKFSDIKDGDVLVLKSTLPSQHILVLRKVQLCFIGCTNGHDFDLYDNSWIYYYISHTDVKEELNSIGKKIIATASK